MKKGDGELIAVGVAWLIIIFTVLYLIAQVIRVII
ncbi:hypothetical protein SEA_SURVIVORS_35 [Gordonia phage Survivors]|uniref:Membrane protein n=1 Tax=Gordonia phage Azira TaxID=3035369 RepID=A0AAF0K7L0_9CAUD|nr:membrane protein [Gordonia phage Azira]UVK59608.1 hypothetical protein SEA_SURVIVORS_35 [Gordonia phage Survivors]WGH21041.1 membrane protein [Gordonia phage Azira]WNM75484.1 membrane protein [Gordonia phage Nibbles]